MIYEEDLTFESEEIYNQFVTYCEWFLDDGNIDEIDEELCNKFRILCNTYIEPNFMQRLMEQIQIDQV